MSDSWKYIKTVFVHVGTCHGHIEHLDTVEMLGQGAENNNQKDVLCNLNLVSACLQFRCCISQSMFLFQMSPCALSTTRCMQNDVSHSRFQDMLTDLTKLTDAKSRPARIIRSKGFFKPLFSSVSAFFQWHHRQDECESKNRTN